MNAQKHLTLSNRTFIEQELLQGSSFKSIGTALGKDPTTISKEVKKHRKLIHLHYASYYHCSGCINWDVCSIRGGDAATSRCERSNSCTRLCKHCYRSHPSWACDVYRPQTCNRPHHFPYVCNDCQKASTCRLEHYIYDAKHAQIEYEKTLVKSRQGINMTPEELVHLNELISPLVLQGQPLSHIFAVHANEIPVCRRTLYNYFDQCIFKARNIDLPRRVRYKKRKKRSEPRLKNIKQIYRNKRTFVDFERFMAAHPDYDVVEMDTVKGSRAAGKCLLTLLFRSCSFMIIILLPDCTQRSVISAINNLCDTIGIRTFKKYFPVILTD